MARRLHFYKGKTRTEVAAVLQRHISSVSRLMAQKRTPKPAGRPRALINAKIDAIVALLENTVSDADGKYEVNMGVIMRRSRLRVCRRVVADATHGRGYRFRNMRQKPMLTPDEVNERFAWAAKYRAKPSAWWLKAVHIHFWTATS